jgi:DNA-binding NarL/FixJ family response regulator
MADEAGSRRLSLSETRVARLVAQGLADEQIADALRITVVEVGAEVAEAIRKLGLRSRTELVFLVPDQPRAEGSEAAGS